MGKVLGVSVRRALVLIQVRPCRPVLARSDGFSVTVWTVLLSSDSFGKRAGNRWGIVSCKLKRTSVY